jgi:hypothetical protein
MSLHFPKIFLLFLFFPLSLLAQQPVEIGRINGTITHFSIDTVILLKALKKTCNDGTVLQQVLIESSGSYHYLVGKGIRGEKKRTIAVQLTYQMASRTFWANPELSHITCTAAACDDCEPYKEKGKILGCHCKALSTVSNQCDFDEIKQSSFFRDLTHFLSLKK